MDSILGTIRKSWNLDTPEEQCGVSCGRRWAMTSASPIELQRLATLFTCPGFASWFQDINGSAVITPERLVDIIGDATHSSIECVDFWNENFGDSDRHAAIWRTPAFIRGFISGAVAVWNRQPELCNADRLPQRSTEKSLDRRRPSAHGHLSERQSM